MCLGDVFCRGHAFRYGTRHDAIYPQWCTAFRADTIYPCPQPNGYFTAPQRTLLYDDEIEKQIMKRRPLIWIETGAPSAPGKRSDMATMLFC
jgi:hypothetical protein